MRKLLLIIPILLLSNCIKADEIKYKKADTGLLYFFVEDRDGETGKIGDIIDVNITITTELDSIIWKGPLSIQLAKASHKGGSIEDALLMLSIGDSALFKIDTKNFYEKTRKIETPANAVSSKNLVFKIKALNIRKYNDYLVEKEKADKQIEIEQLAELEDAVKELNLYVTAESSGLYYVEDKKGAGLKAIPGNLVTVHYTGMFLNGTVFDSSVENNEPFKFRLGTGEVIAGWDEGIAKMCEGGKARLFIPAHLAYGKKGASDIIPPYAALIFEIELLKVHKK